MILLSLNKIITFFKIKDGKLSSLIIFSYKQIFVLGLIIFFSWNFFGLAIVFYFISFYDLILKLNKGISNIKLIINYILLQSILHFSSLFWMFQMKDGFIGFFAYLILNISFVFLPIITKLFFKKINLYELSLLYLIFEYLVNNMDISFPWLIFGNSLSNMPYFIHWYRLVGVFGGSFILLLSSSFIYQNKLSKFIYTIILLSFLSLFLVFFNDKKKVKPLKIAIENLNNLNQKNILVENNKIIFEIIKNNKTIQADYLLIPELSLRAIDSLELSKTINALEGKVKAKKILIGMGGTVKNKLVNFCLLLSNGKKYIKIKQKLVPFSEYLPSKINNYFKKIIFEKGLKDDQKSITKENKICVLICYEAFYSEFVAKKSIDNKAIFLISSEEFLNKSYFGKLQYNNILRLRSIENNIPLIKSTFDGESMEIHNGYIRNILKNNKPYKIDIRKNEKTFYNRFFADIYIYFLLIIYILSKIKI